MTKIINSYRAKEVREGAGVIVNRVFGYYELNDFDPFLMLDYFESERMSDSPGFPWHPHKGIETITYMLKGQISHEDSLGNKGDIGPGELQWMSAGRGIMHQEMPRASEEPYQGFQFWVNLPAKEKLMKPRYIDIKSKEMGLVIKGHNQVRIISGEFEGVKGPIDKSNLGINLFHVIVAGGENLFLTRDKDKKGFIFVFRGNGTIGEQPINRLTAYTLNSGDLNFTNTLEEPLEFIFAQGRPINEAIAWHGPVVMNTNEEIRQTFEDIQQGKFIQ